jgi:hypothetical protein
MLDHVTICGILSFKMGQLLKIKEFLLKASYEFLC